MHHAHQLTSIISVFMSVMVCLSDLMSCELLTLASMTNTLGWMFNTFPKRSSTFPRTESASLEVVSPTAFLEVVEDTRSA
jgi:hypothetical protein